jgi:Tir chaperone protein (CesT) family
VELESILTELQKRFGFDPLVPDKNQIYSLQINNKYMLNLTKAPDNTSFYLYSDIFKIDQDVNVKLNIYERLLGANLFGNETHGSFFAYDPVRSTILLIKRFDNRLVDYSIFFEEFRDFINGLGYWDQVIEEKKSEQAPLAKSPSIDLRGRV